MGTGPETAPVRPGEVFRPGWFYLIGPNGSHLELYPLLIFCADREGQWTGKPRKDAAVYEQLLDKAVEYTATVIRETVRQDDINLIAQVRQLIYYNLEHIKLVGDRPCLSSCKRGSPALCVK